MSSVYAAHTTSTNQEFLTSWKEIACFFGKGVRTVQRWESFGLPVHRPGSGSTVVADPDELRSWARRHENLSHDLLPAKCENLLKDCGSTLKTTRALIAESKVLIASLRELRKGVVHESNKTTTLVAERAMRCRIPL